MTLYISKHKHPTELKLLVLDNDAFHKAKPLKISAHIFVLYSQELNPAENIWAMLKRKFTNKVHKSSEEIT